MNKIIIVFIALTLILCSACVAPEVKTSGKTESSTNTTPTQSNTENTAALPSEVPIKSATDVTTEPTTAPPTEPSTAPSSIVQYDENGDTPRAFMYHLIMETPYNNNTTLFLRPYDFEEQLSALNNAGYQYLYADEYGKTEQKSVILTFDDGYEDNYTTMFPILKKHNAKATVFLIGNLINTPGYLTTAQIKEMADSGYIEFGCHTMSHCYLASQTPDVIRQEIADSVSMIEQITGKECNAIAYPNGSYNDTVTQIASEYVSFAYNSHDKMPVGEENEMHIPRLFIPRYMTAEQLLLRIG